MTSSNPLAKFAFGAAGLAAMLTAFAPVAASAQPAYDQRAPYGQQAYDRQRLYYYNGCERSQNGRSIGGGALGAIGGAVLGGNVASRKVRDEGAILGGVVGAIVGSQIGKSTAACNPRQGGPAPTNSSYGYGYTAPQQDPYAYPPQYGYGYGAQPYDYGYERTPAPRPHRRGYAYGYGNDTARDYDYGYDTRSSDPQDCRMVESRVRLPDGRTQTRMVQACRDSHGEYQLVQ
jgi:hypothetical protein